MSPWVFNAYIYAVMKEVKMGTEMTEVRLLEERGKWRMLGLLYPDDLVLCVDSEDVKVIVGSLVEVFRGGL